SKVGGLRRAGKYAEATSAARQALAIREAALGARHPDTATSLSSLAGLLEAQGEYAAAKPLYEQAEDIGRHNLDLAADAQTERQQLVMAGMLRFHLNAFLSAAPRVGIADGVSYRQVLAWKGAILEHQRRIRDLRRLLRADPRPEVARDVDEWQSTVFRLATLALATPGRFPLDLVRMLIMGYIHPTWWMTQKAHRIRILAWKPTPR
ncbi:MAG: tetratricopeptide repeat protein, partial [Planctomycetaceae bacterium]|nr:tetratricopeptide repeat protein [Planctomycetaceae bacterium]